MHTRASWFEEYLKFRVLIRVVGVLVFLTIIAVKFLTAPSDELDAQIKMPADWSTQKIESRGDLVGYKYYKTDDSGEKVITICKEVRDGVCPNTWRKAEKAKLRKRYLVDEIKFSSGAKIAGYQACKIIFYGRTNPDQNHKRIVQYSIRNGDCFYRIAFFAK